MQSESSETEVFRMFIAADISDAQRTAAADLVARLKKGIQFTKARPSWSRVEGMHLTLKFMGDVDSTRVGEIGEAVAPAAVGVAPFAVSVGGLGVFPNARQPRVLWIGVKEGAKVLCDLQARIDRALRPLGFDPENRAFHPHLTLARIKALSGVEALMDVVQSHKDSGLGTAQIDRLTLYRSQLAPEGSTYTVLHEWLLSGA